MDKDRESIVKENIKHNLINYRKYNQLTGEEVAQALKMNHGTYRSWETGRSSPKLSALIKLAKIYGITIEKLLYDHSELQETNNGVLSIATDSQNEYNNDVYGDEYLSQLSSYEKIVVMKIRQLNKNDKDKLNEFLNDLI